MVHDAATEEQINEMWSWSVTRLIPPFQPNTLVTIFGNSRQLTLGLTNTLSSWSNVEINHLKFVLVYICIDPFGMLLVADYNLFLFLWWLTRIAEKAKHIWPKKMQRTHLPLLLFIQVTPWHQTWLQWCTARQSSIVNVKMVTIHAKMVCNFVIITHMVEDVVSMPCMVEAIFVTWLSCWRISPCLDLTITRE